MIKNTLSVICKTIITSKEENLISFIGCLEAFNTKKLPVKIGPMAFGTFWKKNTKKVESFKVKISVVSPSGKVKELISTDLMEMNLQTHRLSVNIGLIEFEEAGEHKFVAEYDQNGKGFIPGGEATITINKID